MSEQDKPEKQLNLCSEAANCLSKYCAGRYPHECTSTLRWRYCCQVKKEVICTELEEEDVND